MTTENTDTPLKADCPSAPCPPPHYEVITIEAVVQCSPKEAMEIARKMALAGLVECHVQHVGHEGFVGIATRTGRLILPNVKGHASPEHATKIDQTASSASHVPTCYPFSD